MRLSAYFCKATFRSGCVRFSNSRAVTTEPSAIFRYGLSFGSRCRASLRSNWASVTIPDSGGTPSSAMARMSKLGPNVEAQLFQIGIIGNRFGSLAKLFRQARASPRHLFPGLVFGFPVTWNLRENAEHDVEFVVAVAPSLELCEDRRDACASARTATLWRGSASGKLIALATTEAGYIDAKSGASSSTA